MNNDAEEIKKLKKILFRMWKNYKESYFFYIGAVIGRVTYRRFYELVEQYKFNRDDADSFIALQLKHYDYKNLRDSDNTFNDADVDKALDSLKRHTVGVQFIPLILKFKSLQKYFATLPESLPPLCAAYVSEMEKRNFNLNARVGVSENWVRDYFEKNLRTNAKDFDYQFFEILNGEVFSVNGKCYLDLCEVAQLEEIIYNEHATPSATWEQIFEYLKNQKE